MSLKVEDLKVGDQVQIIKLDLPEAEHLHEKIGTVIRIEHGMAFTDLKHRKLGTLYLLNSDTFTYATPYINEQKLKEKLGLK